MFTPYLFPSTQPSFSACTGTGPAPFTNNAESAVAAAAHRDAPFCPSGTSGLFVLYYGPLVDPLDEGEQRTRETIRKSRPNFVVVADVYYNNSRVPDYFHAEGGKATGIRVLAYIATGGGAVNVSRVVGRIDDAMAAGFDGVFFDEVSNKTDPDVVEYYSTIAREVRHFGPGNLVIFNPGTHTVNGSLFEQADIVSVENNTDVEHPTKPPDFSAPPVISPPAKGKIEAWRLLAVQGDPAAIAAPSAKEALKRLDDFRRKAGGFWYYSPNDRLKNSTPDEKHPQSTHTELPDWFDEFASAVNKKGGPTCK